MNVYLRDRSLGGLILVWVLMASGMAGAAESAAEQVQALQQRWAEIRYQLPDEEQEAALAALAEVANRLQAQYPQQAEVLIWQGIVLSTYAGAKGGLGALDLVKQARGSFEQAISLDPQALQGSAYTSLGSLYYQVPGWPLSFGSDRKAREYLEKALALNPQGIDPNYFYGDFLAQQKAYAQAAEALQRALQAPPRPGRELADQGRRGEIEALLKRVQRHL